VDALAYTAHAKPAKPAAPAGRGRSKLPTSRKGILLSLISGVLMGSFYPLVEMSKGGGVVAAGLGPYAVAFLFSLGVFFSTFIYNLYFLNLPVEGEPLSMFAYFKGTLGQHALGIIGGIIWCTGAIANFVAASAPNKVQVGPAISYAIGQGATMVSALWGVLVWKEFAGERQDPTHAHVHIIPGRVDACCNRSVIRSLVLQFFSSSVLRFRRLERLSMDWPLWSCDHSPI
jgi:glucose uptake protein